MRTKRTKRTERVQAECLRCGLAAERKMRTDGETESDAQLAADHCPRCSSQDARPMPDPEED